MNNNKSLQTVNYNVQTFDYQTGDEILILTTDPTTLQDHGMGPFSITQVHMNSTTVNPEYLAPPPMYIQVLLLSM